MFYSQLGHQSVTMSMHLGSLFYRLAMVMIYELPSLQLVASLQHIIHYVT